MVRSFETIENDSDGQVEMVTAITDNELLKIVEISPLAAFVLDAERRIKAANVHLGRILGRSPDELTGWDFRNLVKDYEPRLSMRDAWDLVHEDGRAVSVEAFCRLLPAGGHLVFVTENAGRKFSEESNLEAERKRWQSQRIEALGRLAGGIAHDFNNFLAVLLLQLDILNLHLEPESPIRERVNDIKEVSNSIAGTVRQLFAFGRKQPMTLAPVEINTVVSAFADEFRKVPSEIALELSLEPGLGLCFVDHIQILQVLRNLAANAKEGMAGEGTIIVRTANLFLDSKSVPDIQPSGEYVEIAVTDDGAGLEPAGEEFIFEPFFSTKESDKGAGLTLAMVYGIVKQSKGFIWAEDNPAKGKTFRLQFPRIDVSQAPNKKDESAVSAGKIRAATVLLVDDEESVRRVTAEFLRMSDYEVLMAASGMEALEIAQSFTGQIHLLLTDLSMPLMDGRQLASKIVRMHPEANVLYMSGNIEHVGDETITTAGMNFIAKPFSSTSLTEKVREVLDEGKI